MTHAEHLLENAICALEGGHDFNWWINSYPQQVQIPLVKTTPEEIWNMAQYCVYTYKPGIIGKVEDAYGYSIPT